MRFFVKPIIFLFFLFRAGTSFAEAGSLTYEITTNVTGGVCTLNFAGAEGVDMGELITSGGEEKRVKEIPLSVTGCPQSGLPVGIEFDYDKTSSCFRPAGTYEDACFMKNTGDAYGYGFFLMGDDNTPIDTGGFVSSITDEFGNATIPFKVIFRGIPYSGRRPGMVQSNLVLVIYTK